MQYNIELPQIRDLGEKEQIQELYNYLYRQAELLSYTLSNLESRGAEAVPAQKNALSTFSSIKGLIMESEDIADAVAGKLGDYVTYSAPGFESWYYKTWKNGTFEAFTTAEFYYPGLVKGESVYQSQARLTLFTPFNIGEDAVITATCGGDCWITNLTNSGSYISFRLCADKELDTSAKFKVYLHVIGFIQ